MMRRYATTEKYNIDEDTIANKFYITSKKDNRPMIGGFDTAAEAFEFAEVRVVQVGGEL